MTRATQPRFGRTRHAQLPPDRRPENRRARVFGEAVVIPTPSQLHPERHRIHLTAVEVERSTTVGVPVIGAAGTPRPEEARLRDASNWKLAVFSALPILAGVGLLILGVAPGAVVLRW